MFMVLIGMLQGAMLFGGLSLALNSVVFSSTNWGFVLLLTMIGAVLGALAGLLLRASEPVNVWALPLGSVTVAGVVGVLALAFDFFIFGGGKLHWRGIASLGLISSAPGLIVGWVLSHQFGTGVERQIAAGRGFFGGRDLTQAAPRAIREPLPVMQTTDDVRDARQQHLARLLQAEISQFPPALQVDAPQPVGDNERLCVVASLAGRGASYRFYMVCAPDYPNDPPELLVEQVDRLQNTGGQELRYFSQIVRRWTPDSRLYQVAEELYRDFGGH